MLEASLLKMLHGWQHHFVRTWPGSGTIFCPCGRRPCEEHCRGPSSQVLGLWHQPPDFVAVPLTVRGLPLFGRWTHKTLDRTRGSKARACDCAEQGQGTLKHADLIAIAFRCLREDDEQKMFVALEDLAIKNGTDCVDKKVVAAELRCKSLAKKTNRNSARSFASLRENVRVFRDTFQRSSSGDVLSLRR